MVEEISDVLSRYSTIVSISLLIFVSPLKWLNYWRQVTTLTDQI